MMGKEFNLERAAREWRRQIEAVRGFTESDCRQFESDLLDMADELTAMGMAQEEAFAIASERYRQMLAGSQSQLKQFNEGWLQMRRVTLILSGILAYFFFFYFMQVMSRLLYLGLLALKQPVFEAMRYIYFFIYSFHSLFFLIAVIIYFKGKKFIRHLDVFTLKPFHVLFSLTSVLSLAVIDPLLMTQIHNPFIRSGFFVIHHLSGYTFPLIFLTLLILLYRKYYLACFSENDILSSEISKEDPVSNWAKLLTAEEVRSLEENGLDEREIYLVGLNRQREKDHSEKSESRVLANKASLKILLIMLSGVLIYFLTYFLLQGSSRLLFGILHQFSHDFVFSMRWTWFYAITCQLIVIFFMTSLYIRDINLVKSLEKIKIKPLWMGLIFLATIFSAFIHRFCLIYCRNQVWNDRRLYYTMENIFVSIEFSFPFIIAAGCMVLYYKYYKKMVKDGVVGK